MGVPKGGAVEEVTNTPPVLISRVKPVPSFIRPSKLHWNSMGTRNEYRVAFLDTAESSMDCVNKVLVLNSSPLLCMLKGETRFRCDNTSCRADAQEAGSHTVSRPSRLPTR